MPVHWLLPPANLLHGVLYGSASEQETVATAEGEEHLPPNAGATLDGLSLIQDHVLPLDTVEILYVLHHLTGKEAGREEGGRGGRERREGEREGEREGGVYVQVNG